MKDYKEIIDILGLEHISVSSIEYKEDYSIISIHGGLNGCGDILFYLGQVGSIICMLQKYCKNVWLINWTNDCSDDIWYLKLGVSHE